MKKRFVAGSIAAIMVFTELMFPITSSAAQREAGNESIGESIAIETNVNQSQEYSVDEQNITDDSNFSITKFSVYGNELINQYDDTFKVSIESIKTNNNNGCYGSSKIENAIDNDFSTFWETNKRNDGSFINAVELTLAEETEIGSVVYSARKDGAAGKGFPTTVSIYGATVENEYSLIGTGSYTGAVTDIVEFAFQKTNVKYIKFVFDVANQDWASAAEFQIYKEDTVRRDMAKIFTDGTCMEVTKAYADIDKLNELKTLIATHPLKQDYEDDINLAIDVLNGNIDTTDRVITVNQYGNVANHSKNDLRFNFGAASNYQSTGIASLTGETVTIYVDVENEKYLPQVIFTQFDGDNSAWWKYVPLKKGKNVIVTPGICYSRDWDEPVNSGGALYISNPYTQQQQGRAPKIRIEGGTCFPLLTLDSNDEQFLTKLNSYKEKLDVDAKEYPDIRDRKLIDIFEFEIDHMIFTGTTSGAYLSFVTKGRKPSEVIESWDTFMGRIFKFVGLKDDGTGEKYDNGDHVKGHIFVAQHIGWMVACANHIGIWTSQVDGLLNTFEAARGNWGIAHEIGHTMDIGSRTYKESTNNMLAMFDAMTYGQGYSENNVPYESFTYKSTVSDTPTSYMDQDFFQRIGVFWQLELLEQGYWGKLNESYRESCPSYSSVATGDENVQKEQEIIIRSSDIFGLDLSEHFYRHGFEVTDETRQTLSKYPKGDKTWYLNNGSYDYTGDGLDENTKTDVSAVIDEENSTATLSLSVGKEDKSDVLGYEISRNGKVIAFTGKDTYKDTTIDLTQKNVYSIVAYGYDLSRAKAVSFDALSPNIYINSDVVVTLNSKFNPTDYVVATDYKGNEITQINVSGNVDTAVKGIYTVAYSVTANGSTTSKTVNFEVISQKDPLTSYEWSSIKVGYGNPRVNDNLKLKVLGKTKEFDTGLYIHAASEVVYDLSKIQELDYDRFEAWVGIDQTITPNDNSSVNFDFYLDNEKVYSTPVIKYYSEAQYVCFPLGNAKTLKIVIGNGGNNNTSDHSVIGGMNLLTNNARPVINVPHDSAINVGDSIDLMDSCTASDAEDGELTDRISVSGGVDNTKAGNYCVIYSVTDSDGNKTVVKRFITVSDMSESVDLPADDKRKVSSSNGYGAIGINKSNGGNGLRLISDDGKAVPYETGLGVHATSTVVFDLSNDDYDFFTTDAGVDYECYGNANTSLQMMIYCDGELRYDSGMINSRTPLAHVKVNVKGVSQLKLYVFAGSSNANDHADWCNMKLYSTTDTLKDCDITGTDMYNKRSGDEEFTIDAICAQGLKLSYRSLNPEIATVDSTGKVAIKSSGIAKISVKVEQNTEYKPCEKIIVINIEQREKATITTDKENYDGIYGGADFNIIASTNGGGVLSFISSNTDVVVVDNNGKVSIIGTGTAEIVIKSSRTDTHYEASKSVTVVIAKLAQTISVVNEFNVTIDKLVFPLNATTTGDGTLSYVSSDTSVAVIDDKGNVSVVGTGSAFITISASQTEHYMDATATTKINFGSYADKYDAVITGTKEYTKSCGDVDFVVDSVSVQGLTLNYVSEDENVAIVDEYGKVTVVGFGKTTIKVSSKKTSLYKACEMNVTIDVNKRMKSELTVESSNYNKMIGDSVFKINVTSNGNGAISFSSNNDKVISINEDNSLKINGIGTAIVRIASSLTSTYDEAFKDVTIVVSKRNQIISVKEKYDVSVDKLKFSLNAITTGDGELSYISSDKSVAVVNAAGQVSVVGTGSAVITITAAETEKYLKSEKNVIINFGNSSDRFNAQITGTDLYTKNTPGTKFKLDSVSKQGLTLKFKSDNQKVAIVDSKGNVTITGYGTAKITVSTNKTSIYNEAIKTVTIKVVKVVKKAQNISAKKNITKTYSTKKFSVGAKNLTKNGGKLTYKSSNLKVAVIGKTTGKITIKGCGKTTITVTAAAKGNYKKTIKTVKLVIKPKKETVKKVSGKKNKITVTWKKDSKVTGYQVQYSLKSNFKGSSTVMLKSKSTITTTITKNIKTKKYYVRVRSYKKVGKTYIYGKWSTKKSVKVTK